MLNTFRNKVEKIGVETTLDIPEYLYQDRRMQSASRYPHSEKGLILPEIFLEDIDRSFFSIISEIPFRHNSKLINTLRGKNPEKLGIMQDNNSVLRKYKDLLAG